MQLHRECVKQECMPVGCVPPACWCIPGGAPPWQRPPCHVTCDASWNRDPPVNRMTHRCKNITLPQTSFTGGKYYHLYNKIKLLFDLSLLECHSGNEWTRVFCFVLSPSSAPTNVILKRLEKVCLRHRKTSNSSRNILQHDFDWWIRNLV